MVNKTNDIIYVDLGSCFRTGKDGESYTYYNTKVVTSTSGKESGGAFNLGGVTDALGVGGALGSLAGATTLGGGSNSSISTSEQMQQVIAIPPHGSKLLSTLKFACAKNFKCEKISGDEELLSPLLERDNKVFKKILFKGGVIEYTPENSLVLNKYQITYSTDSQFKKVKNLFFDVFLKYVIGVNENSYFFEGKKRWDKFIEDDISKFIYEKVKMGSSVW